MASANDCNQWLEYGSMYFPSSRVSPRAQVNIYVWQILHLAMTTLKHVLFIIPSPLQCLLSRNSLKKSKPPTHFHTKSSKSADSEWRSSSTFARFQGKCAIYTVLLYQKKNLHSLKSKSHSVFLSIFHVPFRYKPSSQTRNIWLEPYCSLGQVNFISWSPTETQSSSP